MGVGRVILFLIIVGLTKNNPYPNHNRPKHLVKKIKRPEGNLSFTSWGNGSFPI